MEQPEFLKKPEYPEYRNPEFEKFIIAFKEVLINAALCGFCISFMQCLAGDICAVIFLFFYYLTKKMRDNSIYFFSNKGIGANWKTCLKEDICHAIRHSVVTFLCIYGILGLMRWISGDPINETSIQCGVEHAESNQVSCVSTNLPSGE